MTEPWRVIEIVGGPNFARAFITHGDGSAAVVDDYFARSESEDAVTVLHDKYGSSRSEDGITITVWVYGEKV